MAKSDKSTAKARTVARRTAREGQTPANLLRAAAWALRDVPNQEMGLSAMARRQGILSHVHASAR